MEARDNSFALITYGSSFETPRKPANDLKSLDDRFREALNAYHFWKYMPRFRIRAMTFAQRVTLRDMQARVRQFEEESGVTI